MRLADARKLLKLYNGYTVADVRKAFVAACNALHPDTGGTGGDIDALVIARDLLLRNQDDESPCVQCGGEGRVRGRMGFTVCEACQGAGT